MFRLILLITFASFITSCSKEEGSVVAKGEKADLVKLSAAEPEEPEEPEEIEEIEGELPSRITKKLPWIVKIQNPDGSWGTENKRILTSVVLLSFVAQGETPASKDFGQTVKRAMQFLHGEAEEMIKNKKAGEEGAYVVWALSESYSITGIAMLEKPVEALFKILQDEFQDDHWPVDKNAVQHNLICSVALRTSYSAGFDVKDMHQTLKKVQAWLKKENSPYAIVAANYLLSRIGEGVDWDLVKPELSKLMKLEDYSYWRHFFAAELCFSEGGENWKYWQKFNDSHLSSTQVEEGSWPSTPKVYIKMSPAESKIFNTAFARMSLCFYYASRYRLPTSKINYNKNPDKKTPVEIIKEEGLDLIE